MDDIQIGYLFTKQFFTVCTSSLERVFDKDRSDDIKTNKTKRKLQKSTRSKREYELLCTPRSRVKSVSKQF